MTRVAIPALIVMLTVAAFVGAAGYNTSGEPHIVITLTERELALVNRAVSPGDDPGVQLLITYESRYEPLDSRNWLPESRLREIGFALQVTAGSPQAVHAYDHVPTRLAWVVFEYDGPQWRDIERRRAMRAADAGARRFTAMHSRLVPVDAGLDFDTLRQRYPTGHLILRAIIGISYVRDETTGPLIYGRLVDVVPQKVAVPYQFRELLKQLSEQRGSSTTEPRYDGELAVGELGLPYVRALRLRN